MEGETVEGLTLLFVRLPLPRGLCYYAFVPLRSSWSRRLGLQGLVAAVLLLRATLDLISSKGTVLEPAAART